jgi:hypothetical protein
MATTKCAKWCDRFVWTLVLFFCAVICKERALIAQSQPQLVPHSYEVKLVHPEIVSQYVGLNDIALDGLGYVWFSSKSGLHCYDGQKIITYNNNSLHGHLELSDTGSGYYSIHTNDGLHFWTHEATGASWVCIDIQKREVIACIASDHLQSLPFGATAPGEEVYALYQSYSESESTFISCLSCDIPWFRELPEVHSVVSYRLHGGAHWLHTMDSKLWRIQTDFSAMELVSLDFQQYFCTSKTDSLYFYNAKNPMSYIWDDTFSTMRTAFIAPTRVNDRPFSFHKFGDQVWFIDQDRRVHLWDQTAGTLEDYSQLLTELVMKETPMSLSNGIEKGIRTGDGTYLFFSENAIYQFTRLPPEDDHFLEPIESGNPTITSMRGLAEDAEGRVYASYYTGVAVKEKGSDRFVPFWGTQNLDGTGDGTYGLTFWKDHLIWNNVDFDL